MAYYYLKDEIVNKVALASFVLVLFLVRVSQFVRLVKANPLPTSLPPWLDLHPEFFVLIIMLLAVIAFGFVFWLYSKKRK